MGLSFPPILAWPNTHTTSSYTKKKVYYFRYVPLIYTYIILCYYYYYVRVISYYGIFVEMIIKKYVGTYKDVDNNVCLSNLYGYINVILCLLRVSNMVYSLNLVYIRNYLFLFFFEGEKYAFYTLFRARNAVSPDT